MMKFRAWRTALALLAIGCVLGLTSGQGVEIAAHFRPEARLVSIVGEALAPGEYEIRIETPGLREPERGSEINEPGIIYLPPAAGPVRLGDRIDVSGAEIFLFFNSLEAGAGWELVVDFRPGRVQGRWKLNGRFSTQGGAAAEQIIVPVADLEHGENLLHVVGTDSRRPAMFYRKIVTVDAQARAIRETVRTLTTRWEGEVRILTRTGDGGAIAAGSANITAPKLDRRVVSVPEDWWRDRRRLHDAAVAAGRNVLAAQVHNPGSVFDGGFHLVYDATRESHRMAHWIWAWGPSISFLLALEKRCDERELARRFLAAAVRAGRRSLEFGVNETDHPTRGVSTVRWEPSRAVPGGWVEYISTADSLFLAGWGWMPLHAATGEDVFRTRTETLVKAAQRLMGEYPVVPQDWVVQRKRWTPHTLDESVFGMIGFRELHRSTGEANVAAAGRAFLESHLTHMGREDGLLERAWLRDERRAIWDPDIKGHAWVVEGYLDAHALSGETKYLELARRLAARVITCQAEDGAWTYLFKKPATGDARDDKGTAIWAYMLYQLYRKTGDPEHLAAARRATAWCLRQQYRGEHLELDGGLLHTNAMAYVRRRPMTILYSTTFFGLALLEELALRGK